VPPRKSSIRIVQVNAHFSGNASVRLRTRRRVLWPSAFDCCHFEANMLPPWVSLSFEATAVPLRAQNKYGCSCMSYASQIALSLPLWPCNASKKIRKRIGATKTDFAGWAYCLSWSDCDTVAASVYCCGVTHNLTLSKSSSRLQVYEVHLACSLQTRVKEIRGRKA